MSEISPQILFIDFNRLITLDSFPRYPDRSDVPCSLSEIDRNNSFLIFISHCWLRGRRDDEGFEDRFHPDNKNHEKFALCVKGIKKLKDSFAPRMSHCYVWFDYSCMDQDGKKMANDLERYDQIVECCDAIFTPIVDADHAEWTYAYDKGLFSAYLAKSWHEGPTAYLNRAWCRVEMLYAANIPALQNNVSTDIKRHSMFEAGLAFHCSQGRRPHFLYGTKEHERENIPYMLPPLLYSYLTDFHPLQGNLSVKTDIVHIEALIIKLQPYLDANKVVVGYSGDLNESGQKHGRGVLVYENGRVYDGEWKNDKRHGHGLCRYAVGDVFEGEWKEDKFEGWGTYLYSNGDTFKGNYASSFEEGFGTLTYANGNVCEGEWHNGLLVTGTARYVDGNVYYGEFKDHYLHGNGRLVYANGDVYEGQFEKRFRHGVGTYIHKDTGNIFKGHYLNDKMNGEGVMSSSGGEIIQQGVWHDNVFVEVV